MLQGYKATFLVADFAILLSKASKQIAFAKVRKATPSFVAWFAFSFLGILRWPKI